MNGGKEGGRVVGDMENVEEEMLFNMREEEEDKVRDEKEGKNGRIFGEERERWFVGDGWVEEEWGSVCGVWGGGVF